jgi:4-amino-4-deoxy-L-arabinose transferase-like glycosyltransferase
MIWARPRCAATRWSSGAICQGPITAGQMFGRWLELMGMSGQFPFSMATTKAFLETFDLAPTFTNLRLPSALWGILTVLAAYRLGLALRGPWLGVLLAALLALHPFHIQMTREAYYYPPLVLGSFLATAAAVRAFRSWRARAPDPHRWTLVAEALLGFFLMTYSQPTGWLVAFFLAVVALLGWLDLFRRRVPASGGAAGALLGGFVLIGLPLLTTPWALPQLLKISSGAIKEQSLKAFAVSTETFGDMLFKATTSFAWGATASRAALTFGALAFGLWALTRRARREPALLLLPATVVVGILAFLYARESAGALFEARYIIGILPAYLAVLALGIAEAGEVLAVRWKPAPAVLGLAALLPLAPPAWLCTQLTGQPAPYADIVRWCDAHLPPGAPVLVDRWFEPNNELRPYPSTNVHFTFTVPNEPLDTFRQVRWRETAMDFFQRFPDAAYLEVARTYWDVPEVGPWPESRAFFARQTAVVNRAGVRLRELGLAARGDFYWANTNRLVVDVLYNTREDVMAARAKAGMSAFVYYGPGWGYAKTQDFRDWRVLQERAELQLINLTTNELEAKLVVRGVAIGEPRELLSSAGGQFSFPANQIGEWTGQAMKLPPGITRVELRASPAGRNPFLLEGAALAR